MSKQSKGYNKRPLQSHLDPEYNDLEVIMESDMEDFEVAAELGLNVSQVSKMRRELFED